jgi:hypothetical protein
MVWGRLASRRLSWRGHTTDLSPGDRVARISLSRRANERSRRRPPRSPSERLTPPHGLLIGHTLLIYHGLLLGHERRRPHASPEPRISLAPVYQTHGLYLRRGTFSSSRDTARRRPPSPNATSAAPDLYGGSVYTFGRGRRGYSGRSLGRRTGSECPKVSLLNMSFRD